MKTGLTKACFFDILIGRFGGTMGKMNERRRKRRQIAKAVKQEVTPKRQGAGDLVVNRTGAGVHSSKKGDKGYKRHPKHKSRDNY